MLAEHGEELLLIDRACAQVVTWVPQNDVLGHPSTKAFLSHCGANGMNEVSPVCALKYVKCHLYHVLYLAKSQLVPLGSHQALGLSFLPDLYIETVKAVNFCGAGCVPWRSCRGHALLRRPAHERP